MSTLAELVSGRGFDASQGIVDEVSKLVPELAFFDSLLIPGTSFQGVSQTSDPATGFRAVGKGIAASDEGYALATYSLGILAGLVQRDKAAFDADVRGRDAALAAAAVALVRSGMKTLAAKVWGGSAEGDEKFAGASALVKDALVVDAGGEDSGSLSSVYAVGRGLDRCHLVFNEASPLLNAGELEWKEGTMTVEGATVPTYWTDLTCWAGFACRNSNSVARVANLGAGKPLTDELLAELVAKYAEANDGLNPDGIFCTFAQRLALQKSRGTTVRTAARSSIEITASVPLEYDGIPIYATNALGSTEAKWTAS